MESKREVSQIAISCDPCDFEDDAKSHVMWSVGMGDVLEHKFHWLDWNSQCRLRAESGMNANGLFGIGGLKANGIKLVFMKKEEQRLQLWRTLVSGTHAGAVESGEKDEGSAELDGQTTLMWSETLKKWLL